MAFSRCNGVLDQMMTGNSTSCFCSRSHLSTSKEVEPRSSSTSEGSGPDFSSKYSSTSMPSRQKTTRAFGQTSATTFSINMRKLELLSATRMHVPSFIGLQLKVGRKPQETNHSQ